MATPSYPGPADRLAVYEALIARHGEAERKGAKNPYTSRNGWMSSFIDPEGEVCLRLDRQTVTEALDTLPGARVAEQYGRTMKDFLVLPRQVVDDDALADAWFARSWDWTGSLDPK